MAHFGPDLTNVGHTDELARIFGIFVYSSIPSTAIVILRMQCGHQAGKNFSV